MRRSRRRLFILSAPSGGGKNTVIQRLLQMEPELRYAVSATTRPPRPGEKNGVHYFFLDDARFQKKVMQHAFLEHATVHGFQYGTLWSEIHKNIRLRHHVIMDLDYQGGIEIKKKMDSAVLIFLLPPSVTTLRERLLKRGTDASEDIEKRLKAAEQEISNAQVYDYQIINEDLDKTVNDVRAIIQSYSQ